MMICGGNCYMTVNHFYGNQLLLCLTLTKCNNFLRMSPFLVMVLLPVKFQNDVRCTIHGPVLGVVLRGSRTLGYRVSLPKFLSNANLPKLSLSIIHSLDASSFRNVKILFVSYVLWSVNLSIGSIQNDFLRNETSRMARNTHSYRISNNRIIITITTGMMLVRKKSTTSIIMIKNSWHMMTSSNVNICRVTGPLCGEFTGHRWIPLTKASDVELWCFLWSAPEQTVE